MDLPLPVATTSAPFVLHLPPVQTAPVVFVSAHSGADYPAAFLQSSRLDPTGLRRSEDCFVDELFADAPDHGAPLLAATFPRAFCDANREKWELDPAMFDEALPPWVNTASARVGAGLGTLARVVASGESIYRAKLPFAEAVARAEGYWQPFHDALRALVEATRTRFGVCLLVDCHSMPAAGGAAGRPAAAQIVLGDAHGTACAAPATRFVEQAFVALGYSVRRNDPYAGGYITRHYGRPREGVHAVQIEIARGLYMDEASLTRGPAFSRVRGHAGRVAAALAAEAGRLLTGDATAGKKVATP
jgi:N-formylglutamate deformylase